MIRLLRRVRRNADLVVELVAYVPWLLIDAGRAGDMLMASLGGLLVPGIVLLRRVPGANTITVAALAVGMSVAISGLTRTPVVALLGLAPTGTVWFSFAEMLALAVIVVAVLRRCALRPALVLTAAAAAAIVGSPVARLVTVDSSPFSSLCALGWGGAVAIGLVLREMDTRRRAALEEVRSTERMELARELHDVVAHHVTGIVVAAQAAAVVARRSPDDVDRALAAIETAGTDALAAMRSMVGVLRGQHSQDAEATRTPGAQLREVRDLVDRFDPEARLVRLATAPGLEQAVLPAGIAATGYRVVQEALTNVRRHAPDATAVEVDIRMHEEALLVSVCNDGVSTAGAGALVGPSAFGLAGMAERVAALDGTLTAGPSAAGVWTVSVRLPLVGMR